ncbi:MAG: DeoR/GlpR family DNA-binding transcription regulator [Anaerolineales bacterium]
MVGKILIPAQRRQKIRQYLEDQGIAQSAALGELLGVSEATVRRDLERLEKEGVERTHGGAMLSQRLPKEPAYARSALAHPEEKRRIGRAAAELVEPGDTIFVNSGTTTTQFVRALRGRPALAGLTVVTNSLSAALEAREGGWETILVGGSFRPISNSVVGRFAVETLRQIYAAKAFLGVDGISLKFGCTTPISGEAEVARQMIEHARGSVVIVADHSKWGVVSNFPLASLDEIDVLVADDGLAPQWRRELEARRVSVRIAESEHGDGARNALGRPEPIAAR